VYGLPEDGSFEIGEPEIYESFPFIANPPAGLPPVPPFPPLPTVMVYVVPAVTASPVPVLNPPAPPPPPSAPPPPPPPATTKYSIAATPVGQVQLVVAVNTSVTSILLGQFWPMMALRIAFKRQMPFASELEGNVAMIYTLRDRRVRAGISYFGCCGTRCPQC
jgi:hypothetical protein